MKKICISLALALLLASLSALTPACATEPQQLPFEVQSQAVYMENLETGQVMVSKNADQRFPPASLTKIMTAILTLENVQDIQNEDTYLKVYLNDMIYGTGASTGGFYPGDQATIQDILYDALVHSAAECALMLADYVGDGSVEHFVEMMNTRARELGCTDTLFTDPHGLDEAQYTTARDMALIAKHAMSLPVFAEIVGTSKYQFKVLNRDYNIILNPTNKMLLPSSSYFYAPIQGIKTGTLANVRSLATQAKHDGYTYLTVQLGVPIYNPDGTLISDPDNPAVALNLSFVEAKQLYQWVFDSFSIRTAVERGEEPVEIKVKESFDGDFVRLATAEQFTALLHKNIDVSSILYVPDIPDYLVAPVKKGQEVGRLKLIYMEEEIGSVPLVTTAALSKSDLLAFAGWFRNEIHTFRVKFMILFAILIILLYTALIVRAQNLKKRSGKYSSYRQGEDKTYHI